MDMVTSTTLHTLMEPQRQPCLSLFVPMVQAGKETRQNAIRFKNALGAAEEQLAAAGLENHDIETLLQPLQNLHSDTAFWQHQSQGLAIFRSFDALHTYRLPLAFEDDVIVAPRFHLKPILPVLTSHDSFFVLALSQNQVRLFAGTRYELEELELPEETPRSMAAALAQDDPERQVQFRSNVPTGRGNHQAAVYHGQADPDERTNLLRYFMEVDRGVQQVLHDQQAPLVLAAVEELLPLYHDRNNYPHLIDAAVLGNPDAAAPHDLHAQAWQVVEPHFQREQQHALERFPEAQAKELADHDLRTVLPAAVYGRVDTLFVAWEVQQWGRFDAQRNTLDIHPQQQPNDEDLLNMAVLHTLRNSGRVYVLEPATVPGGPESTIAAIFRYPAPAA